MRAAVNVGRSDVRAKVGWLVKEVPDPEAGPGQVVVEVAACAICGSDHKFLNAEGVRYIPGHEFAGVVAALGEGVTGWSVGDRVSVNPVMFCGECEYCRAGKQNLCVVGAVLGFQADGAFAERVVVPASNLVPAPEGIPLEVCALADPIAVGIHALGRVNLDQVKTAVVLGLGGIGFPAAMLLRKRCQVICVEIAERKTEIARKFGLEVIDGRGDVQAALAGKRIDLCVDVAGGTAPTFNLGLALLRKDGTLLCISERHRFEMDFPPLEFRELTIKGVFAQCADDFRAAVELVGKEPWPQAMITARHELQDFGDALQAACSGQHLKVVVSCVH